MKLYLTSVLTILAFFSSCGKDEDIESNVTLSTKEDLEENRVKEREYLVAFKSDQPSAPLEFSSFREEYGFHYLSLVDKFLSDPKLLDIDVLTSLDFRSDDQNSQDGWSPPSLQLAWRDRRPASETEGVLTKVTFKSEADAASTLHKWDQEGKIWYAEPNGLSKVKAEDEFWKEKNIAYAASNVTWHNNIGLLSALNALGQGTITGASSTDITANPPIIAVLDSGVDYEHPDLKDNIWVNDKIGIAGCSNDLHGCNTTVAEKGSFGNGDVWPAGLDAPGKAGGRGSRHGTHVSGLIAAKPTDGIGGVCPVCKIMILKVATPVSDNPEDSPSIADDAQIRGLKYVTRFKNNDNNAVRIVNASFGKYSRTRSLTILVDVLKKVGNGTLIIAAASNEDSMVRSYPAALTNVVAVSAVDDTNKKAPFSNFGPWVDVAAPGVRLKSTIPGGEKDEDNGTSMAAPVVAGAAGMYVALNPGASFEKIQNRIIDCANPGIYTDDSEGARYNFEYYFPKVQGESARRPLLGSGLVNVNNMLSGSDCKGAVGRPLDRVTPGCSSIGADHSSRHSSVNTLLLLVIILSPILVVWSSALRRDRVFRVRKC
jgi:subtilisin family serine protease